jgi:hypothetical protein
MTEAVLQEAIIECARTLGWLVYHTHDSRHSAKGFPDLALVRDGRLVFAELKAEGKNPTLDQEAWLLELRTVGTLARPHNEGPRVQAFLWRPDDWLSGRIESILR